MFVIVEFHLDPDASDEDALDLRQMIKTELFQDHPWIPGAVLRNVQEITVRRNSGDMAVWKRRIDGHTD